MRSSSAEQHGIACRLSGVHEARPVRPPCWRVLLQGRWPGNGGGGGAGGGIRCLCDPCGSGHPRWDHRHQGTPGCYSAGRPLPRLESSARHEQPATSRPWPRPVDGFWHRHMHAHARPSSLEPSPALAAVPAPVRAGRAAHGGFRPLCHLNPRQGRPRGGATPCQVGCRRGLEWGIREAWAQVETPKGMAGAFKASS